MSLDGRELEWGLLVILASVAGKSLGVHVFHSRHVASDRTMLLPTRTYRSEGLPEGRPWLMLKSG